MEDNCGARQEGRMKTPVILQVDPNPNLEYHRTLRLSGTDLWLEA